MVYTYRVHTKLTLHTVINITTYALYKHLKHWSWDRGQLEEGEMWRKEWRKERGELELRCREEEK